MRFEPRIGQDFEASYLVLGQATLQDFLQKIADRYGSTMAMMSEADPVSILPFLLPDG